MNFFHHVKRATPFQKTFAIVLIMVSISTIPVIAQNFTFSKRITNNDGVNYITSMKQGLDSNYFVSINKTDGSGFIKHRLLLKIDKLGNVKDSIFLDSMLGKTNVGASVLMKDNHGFALWTTLTDSDNHYVYVQEIDTNLVTVQESVIDTIDSTSWCSYVILNHQGNYVMLILKNIGSGYEYSMLEFDTSFNVTRKASLGYTGSAFCSFLEMSCDSSYVITSQNYIIKTNYSFTDIDTIRNRLISDPEEGWHYNNTFKMSDSTYAENIMIPAISGSTSSFQPGFYLRAKNAEKFDSVVFIAPYDLNKPTVLSDFISYYNEDTIYYCAIVDYKSYLDASSSSVLLAKFCRNGDIIWMKIFGNNYNYSTASIEACSDGGCLLQCGFWDYQTYPSNFLAENIELVKFDKDGNFFVGKEELSIIDNDNSCVFPNPATNSVYINNSNGKYQRILIYNYSGQLIQSNDLESKVTKIDLFNLRAGIYFYSLIGKNEIQNYGKLIVL